MTPAGRVIQSISSMRGKSAWSPMPEHLLFLDKKKPPDQVIPDGEHKCEDCGMNFKTAAMLSYHQVGFCIGPPTEEIPPEELSPRAPFRSGAETSIQPDPARPGTVSKATGQQLNTKKQKKLEWCTCANGAVPPSAAKVGYDDSDRTYTYICVAKVGDEIVPGTVLPPRGHATVALNGEVVKATEYSVLTDPEGLLSWKRCDVVGGVPSDAVKGGYDSTNSQYFIARGKCPDGNWYCGQYIPQKQQCLFAWEGAEYTKKDFEVLCKSTVKQYFNETFAGAPEKSKQTKEYTGSFSLQDRTRDFTDLPPSQAELSPIEEKSNDTNGLPKSNTGVIERDMGKGDIKTRQDTGITDMDKVKSEMSKSGTEVMTQDKNKVTTSTEKMKPHSGVTAKGRSRTNTPRELIKSGTAIASKDKPKANNSRANTGIRSKSQNLQF